MKLKRKVFLFFEGRNNRYRMLGNLRILCFVLLGTACFCYKFESGFSRKRNDMDVRTPGFKNPIAKFLYPNANSTLHTTQPMKIQVQLRKYPDRPHPYLISSNLLVLKLELYKTNHALPFDIKKYERTIHITREWKMGNSELSLEEIKIPGWSNIGNVLGDQTGESGYYFRICHMNDCITSDEFKIYDDSLHEFKTKFHDLEFVSKILYPKYHDTISLGKHQDSIPLVLKIGDIDYDRNLVITLRRMHYMYGEYMPLGSTKKGKHIVPLEVYDAHTTMNIDFPARSIRSSGIYKFEISISRKFSNWVLKEPSLLYISAEFYISKE